MGVSAVRENARNVKVQDRLQSNEWVSDIMIAYILKNTQSFWSVEMDAELGKRCHG